MKLLPCLPLSITVAFLTLSAAHAEITVDGSAFLSSGSSTIEITFDASGSDKLVVVVTGEHGFNQTANGDGGLVTYDGVELTQLIDRDAIKPNDGPPVIDVDDTWNDIWYLDDPGAVHSAGLVTAMANSRGSITVFGLSGTAPGAGNTVIGERDTRSAELTTSATGSIVIASFGTGGAGNTGDVQNVSADLPLTQTSSTKNGAGRNWDGHVTGYAIEPNVGTAAYSFSGGNEDGAHVIAAEFLAADGTAGPIFAITDIIRDFDTGMLTLTWPSSPGEIYAVNYSTDLIDWAADLDDGIDAAAGDETTEIFDLNSAGLSGEEQLFFRVTLLP